MARSRLMAACSRGVPSGSVRATTSGLMASATTSCSTLPTTTSICAITYSASGRAREQRQPRRDQAATEEDVGAALRAEDGERVHQLAEDHLGHPRQLQPA